MPSKPNWHTCCIRRVTSWATPPDQRTLPGLLPMWGTTCQVGQQQRQRRHCAHFTGADIIACIVEQQPPLPHALDGGGSILQYVEYMSGKNQQQQQQQQQQQRQQQAELHTVAEGEEHVTAYIKGGVAGWQGQAQPDADDAVERTMQL